MTGAVRSAIDRDESTSDAWSALWSPLEQDRGSGAFLETWDGAGFQPWTWDEWRAAAHRTAGALNALGVEPGARVGMLLGNGFPSAATLVGAWLAGATVVSLPLIARGATVDGYRASLERICGDGAIELVVAEAEHAALLDTLSLPVSVRACDTLLDGPSHDPTPPADGDPLFVQYSSGSTSDPKGCVLTASAVGAQLVRLREALGADADDRTVAWLPLSHDMGCFGCLLLSWYAGNRIRLSTPTRFLRRPRTWMGDCADFGATLSPVPNFALELAARAAVAAPPSGRLALRSVILGGERNEWGTIQAALDSLGPVGLRAEAITPAYGLAEATLAVTMKPNGSAPTTLELAREEILGAGAEGVTKLVSSGVPLRDVELDCGDDGVGQIRMKSPALASEYLANPEATASRFHDGELWTEDLGFVRDGQLYVVGRQDDVVCVGGRNIHARDIETRLTPDIGVRAGNAVVVALDDGPRSELVALVEPTLDAGELSDVARAIARTARDAAGVRLTRCVFLERGALPKTPSGKVRRRHCRDLARDGSGVVIDVDRL